VRSRFPGVHDCWNFNARFFQVCERFIKKSIFTGTILPILFSFGKMRDVNIQLQAYCPDCQRTVTAFLLSGSLEQLQKNDADVVPRDRRLLSQRLEPRN
jgi:hypothetical protein